MHIDHETIEKMLKDKDFKILIFIIECNIYKRNK